jgi:hypothetical protein
VPVAEGTGLGSRMTACRWHLVDSEPFTKSLRFVAAIGPEAAAAIRRIEGGE